MPRASRLRLPDAPDQARPPTELPYEALLHRLHQPRPVALGFLVPRTQRIVRAPTPSSPIVLVTPPPRTHRLIPGQLVRARRRHDEGDVWPIVHVHRSVEHLPPVPQPPWPADL